MLTARIYGSLTPTQVARRGLFFLAGCASTPSLATFCESDDSLKDKLLRKDKDGNIQWAKSIEQVTKGPFWDEVAAMTGNKVRCSCLVPTIFQFTESYSTRNFFSMKGSKCGRFGYSYATLVWIHLWLLLGYGSQNCRTCRCSCIR